jgi:hypothetical protein
LETILKEGNETNENDFYLLKANENQLKMLKNISFNLPLDQEKYTDESNWITSKNFDVLTTDGLEMQNLKSYPIFRKREKQISKNHIARLAKLFKVSETELNSFWVADKILALIEDEKKENIERILDIVSVSKKIKKKLN